MTELPRTRGWGGEWKFWGGDGEGVERAEQGVSKVWCAENAALDIFKNKDKIWERERGWKYLVYMFTSSEHVWL